MIGEVRARWPQQPFDSKQWLPSTQTVSPAGVVSALVIADLDGAPLYASQDALEILMYPGRPTDSDESRAHVQRRIRSILNFEELPFKLPTSVRFTSGQGTYVCRTSLLESQRGKGEKPTLVLLLDRQPVDTLESLETLQHVQLTRREREVVRCLIDGLTTKQIATFMQISPNTVKVFIRVVMGKMGVTTRSAIVGKFLSSMLTWIE